MNDLEQFALRIRKDPDDLEAWKGLLALVDDPGKKKDCQEQVDRILAKQQAAPMLCPQCGGRMEVYFAGELHDKRARCPYCGTDVDIPDSYSKVEVETHKGPGHFLPDTKVTVFERRADNAGGSISSEEIEKLIMEKGVVVARQELEARGIHGVKISGFSGVNPSSEDNRILEEEGLEALGKAKGAIVLSSGKANTIIKVLVALSIIIPIVVIIVFLARIFIK